jgi:hypothetical protein
MLEKRDAGREHDEIVDVEALHGGREFVRAAWSLDERS